MPGCPLKQPERVVEIGALSPPPAILRLNAFQDVRIPGIEPGATIFAYLARGVCTRSQGELQRGAVQTGTCERARERGSGLATLALDSVTDLA